MGEIIGEIICHQDIRRSFYSHGVYMLLCARCSGIYIGFLISFLFFMSYTIKINLREILTGLFFLIIFGLSVLFKDNIFNTNLTRYISGILLGIACSTLCISALSPSIVKSHNYLKYNILSGTTLIMSVLLLSISYQLLNVIIIVSFCLFCCFSNASLIRYLLQSKYQNAIFISLPFSFIELFIIKQIKLLFL